MPIRVVVLAACAGLLLSGCAETGSDQSSGVATETQYVDSNGSPVAAPSTGQTTEAQTEPPTVQTEVPTVQRVELAGFTSPDGSILCRGGVEMSGSWGGQSQKPEFGCFSTGAQIAKPTFSSCSQGAARFGGAGALGSGWVARGICTGGVPFTTDGLPATTVGQQISSGPVACSIEAADTVACTFGAESFRLSSASITVSGNDVTAG